MRIAVVQFDPKIGEVEANLTKANKLCETLQPDSVDLVCLPEMIFSGYVFPDSQSITPFLEEPHTGPTSRFCSDLARRLRCYVVAGYPERLPAADVHTTTVTVGDAAPKEVTIVGANAAALYGPAGEPVGIYHKSNLYDTDMTWARGGKGQGSPATGETVEGHGETPGFATFRLPPPLGALSLAICMDLNVRPPAVWTSLESGPFEVAEYCVRERTKVLVLLNAWLDSKNRLEDDDTDWQTVNYWAMRLRPLWAKVQEEASLEEDDDAFEDEDNIVDGTGGQGARKVGDEVIAVVCNRCGEENNVLFAGSSTMFNLAPGVGRPKVLHHMTRRQEGVEIWTVPNSEV
ncbi:carbon-nitrogen hydrolase [Epithele typhae]|uniref:carbon-nitrogen hydrolase n=1 Tax=Epithele typhae TaxID=378194 RepID=UPI0020077E28|nr:carbon-nitrogen hydrolase [Epithele typhae]KAH9931651.1 carbon-nitrogen hydrolase [Epithele typhae]